MHQPPASFISKAPRSVPLIFPVIAITIERIYLHWAQKANMCWRVLLGDVGILIVSFHGSCIEEKWPPLKRINAKSVKEQYIHIGVK